MDKHGNTGERDEVDAFCSDLHRTLLEAVKKGLVWHGASANFLDGNAGKCAEVVAMCTSPNVLPRKAAMFVVTIEAKENKDDGQTRTTADANGAA